MRKIGRREVELIALGASLLGSGGGGDPYIGKLIALGTMGEDTQVDLIDPMEVPDDAFVVPVAMMGAPTIMMEKGIGSIEFSSLIKTMESFFGKKIFAVMPAEAGGCNSLIPLAAAAQCGLPMVDCDGMGRAFPELQMVTFTIGSISATPMCLADEKGNSCIFRTISNKWAEEIARSVTMSCGGSVLVSLFPMEGWQMKQWSVKNIVTRSMQIGKAIENVKKTVDGTPEEAFLKESEGILLFRGKISDLLRETNGKFNTGRVILDGIAEFRGQKASVVLQNENLMAEVNGTIVATTPDLICMVDTETFRPITTENLKYGKRVLLLGYQCYEAWRSPGGLELVGPRYFGIDTDYVPVEERVKGARHV